MTNENKKLEILVVDDRAENIAAARTALKGKANVDVAMNYEDGLKKLESKVYAFGIFDIQMPRKEGMKTENLGFDLEKAAEKYALDHALITAGIDHHNCNAAFVRYCFDEKRNKGFEDACIKHGKTGYDSHTHSMKAKNFHEITEIPKSNPRAWNHVYDVLIKEHPNVQEIFESKQRYFKTLGKMYISASYEAEQRRKGANEK